MMEGERFAVVGCGTIGVGWAALAAYKGRAVRVFDPATGTAKRVDGALARLEEIFGPSRHEGSVTQCETLGEALSDADFVQENGPESVAAKRDLFARIADLAPAEAVIATSSSGLAISDIQNHCAGPERCIIGHPFNPPHLIPLVEVIAGERTSQATIDRAMRFYAGLGKKPLLLTSEIQGYVANRLQNALFREAVYLVENGAATVEDVDRALIWGPGLRWALMGPFLTFALGGGSDGMRAYFEKFDEELRLAWGSLGTPQLTEETKRKIIDGVDRMMSGQPFEDVIADRDRNLARVIAAVDNLSRDHG